MGWWSCDVLGGDKPLDIRGDMIDAAGGNEIYMKLLESEKEEHDLLHKQLALKLLQGYQNGKLIPNNGSNISWQVFGAVVMEFKLPIKEEERKRVMQAAEDDKWAKESNERKECMMKFINDIQNYVFEEDVKPQR